jgi:hypothetical protein
MRKGSSVKNIAAALVLTLTVLALTGCVAPSPPPAAEPTRSTTPTPTPTGSAAPVATELAFVMPEDCRSVLPESRRTTLDAGGISLLGGPGGKYAQYFADPTPEERAGGITCVWGDDATDAASITISVAPLGATRAEIVQSLLDQGLNEAIDDDVTLYAKQGDENESPAIVNVLRADSWISVIQTVGGPASFDEALTVADEVGKIVYVRR